MPREEVVITSVYDTEVQRTFIEVYFPSADITTRLLPQDAVQLGLSLITLSLSADTDRFLVEFFRNVITVPDDKINFLLTDLNEWRKKEQMGGR